MIVSFKPEVQYVIMREKMVRHASISSYFSRKRTAMFGVAVVSPVLGCPTSLT